MRAGIQESRDAADAFGMRSPLPVALILLLASCAGPGAPPVAPVEDPLAYLRPQAFSIEADLSDGTLTVSPPQGAAPAGQPGPNEPPLEVVLGDAVDVSAGALYWTAVGAFTPGRRRIALDLAITNRLPDAPLVSPLSPTPPAEGVVVFPLDYIVLSRFSGNWSGDNAGSVTPTAPVAASPDWDGDGAAMSGAPFDFPSGTPCQGTVDRCRRWEQFVAPLPAQSSSGTRRVGFDVESSVRRFRVRVLVLGRQGPPV